MSNRVLIVDDEKYICSILKDYLEEWGFDVSTSADLAGARTEISKPTLPDVLVVDLTLPDGDGLSFLKEIRGDERTKEIPFILITAHIRENRGNATGPIPNDTILKPFNLSDFKNRLEQQIKQPAKTV